MTRLASELGAPPSQKMLAIGAIMMAMRHHPGMARPVGGTGALVTALLNLIHRLGRTGRTAGCAERELLSYRYELGTDDLFPSVAGVGEL